MSTPAALARDVDDAAQRHVEGRATAAPYMPRERHPKLYDTSLGGAGEVRTRVTAAPPEGAIKKPPATLSDDIPTFLLRGHADCRFGRST